MEKSIGRKRALKGSKMFSIIKKKRWTKSNTSFTKKQKIQVDRLLKENKPLTNLDKDKNNLLHLAVICNELLYVKTALKIEGLIDEENKLGFTPKDLALFLGREKIIPLIQKEKKHQFKVLKNGKRLLLNQKEFEKYFDLSFYTDLRFANIAILNWIVKRCSRAVKKNDMTRQQKWLGKYYATEIESGKTADVRIEFISSMMGYGLFADKKIKKKAFIAEYVGLVRKYNFDKDYKNAYCFEYMIADVFDTPFIIDAKDSGNIARFVNHDPKGNVTPVAIYYKGMMRVILQANKDISKDEQICYDYGSDYWADREDPSSL